MYVDVMGVPLGRKSLEVLYSRGRVKCGGNMEVRNMVCGEYFLLKCDRRRSCCISLLPAAFFFQCSIQMTFVFGLGERRQ